MEQLGRCVAEWRASLLDKGLKMNAGKSKVIVGRSNGKTLEIGPVVSMGKECRQTLFSAQYVQI